MSKISPTRSLWVTAVSMFAILFGLMTLKSGGSVLFTEAASKAAGDYVRFVVWFNFIAGFAYIAAGVGIWKLQRWAGALSAIIAISTLLVFVAFGVYVMSGGSYEMRTVVAMTFRFSLWAAISYFYCRLTGCRLKAITT